MPNYCCVPGCTNKRGHLFPASAALQMRWRVAINRKGPGEKELWEPNLNHDVVCHDHFVESDYVLGRKKKILKRGAVPSVFSHHKKQSSMRRRTRLRRSRKNLIANRSALKTASSDASKKQDHQKADASVQCTLVLPKPFSIDNYITVPRAIQYFTGFDNYHHFNLLYDIFRPNLNELQCRCTLLPAKDQLFLTLLKLRLCLDHQLIGHMFGISESTVSKIFSAWINYMYSQFKKLDIWPSKKVIVDSMPADFKKLYPSTRVIIDYTEIPIEKPSCIDAQNQTFSRNKNKNTIKLIIGITPRGAVSFISDCYGGSASDRQIIEGSGLYQKAEELFEKGDSIMAVKGFLVQDLFAPFGISITTPTVLKDRLKDSTISLKQVDVERVIGYAKTYKILQGVIPYNLLPLSNKIVYVCFVLVNFRTNTVN